MRVDGRDRLLRLAAACVCAVGISVLSASPGLAKYASVIMDADTGRVVHAVNANTRNYPASLTKMMTLYKVFEALEDGRLSMNQRLKVSARAARQPSSKLGLRRGQTITVKQAILAMVTKSANDVAAAVAEALSGSERNFALAMTATARRLGMARTIFRNASGLPHRGQQSTARDMAVLARALITDFPQHYHYFSTRTFTFGGIRHRNHNKMIATYDGADGIKTGYIRASGFNLVASAKRGGHRLIGVVFGGRSPRARNRHMARLLDKGFRVVNGTPTRTAAADEGRRKKKATRKRRASTRSASASKSAAAPARKSKSRWGIQVGAYMRYSPAYERAVKVVERLPGLLENGTIRVVPLKIRNRRPVYRARILGITKRQAYRACRILKKRKMDCMEMRLKGVQMAFAGP
ncbi:MAG: D-alanyl-D-alanine carboxypeptidase family protein [Rhodospirillales bacterium]